MAVLSQSDLGEALGAGDFDRSLGTQEGAWIDFKSEPYSFEGNGSIKLFAFGRWELCKDVAAMANHHGGCLLLGVTTVKRPTLGIEVADAIRLIPLDLVDLEAYRKVLALGIYPPVRDLNVRWHKRVDSDDRGLLLIEIPPQDDGNRPFVIRRMMDESGSESGPVGIPIRNVDQTDWYTAERIHHEIRAVPLGSSGGSSRSGSDADARETGVDLRASCYP